MSRLDRRRVSAADRRGRCRARHGRRIGQHRTYARRTGKGGGRQIVRVRVQAAGTHAAVDGRICLDTGIAEVVGLAPVGGGTALQPVEIPGGLAFGAYSLNPRKGRTSMRVVVSPHADARARLPNRHRCRSRRRRQPGGCRQAEGDRVTDRRTWRTTRQMLSADSAPEAPLRPARALVRDLVADGSIDAMDLDIVRAGMGAWRERTMTPVTSAATRKQM